VSSSRHRRGFSQAILAAGLFCAGLAVGGALLLHRVLPALDWMQAWLLSISVVTFLTYGYDKMIAGRGVTRVPERVLLGLAFAGGTVGAVLGMRLFHHKISKESFLERFWLIVAVQIVLIAGWYIFLRPR
jgi:uncharacterized membrane protein YsdA (DUF1294 family)